MAKAYYVGQISVLVSAEADQAEQLSEALESIKDELGTLLTERLKALGFEAVNAPSTLVAKIYEEKAVNMVPKKTHLPPQEKT